MPKPNTVTTDDWFALQDEDPQAASDLLAWIRSHIPEDRPVISARIDGGTLHVETAPADPGKVEVVGDEIVTLTTAHPLTTNPPCWPAGLATHNPEVPA